MSNLFNELKRRNVFRVGIAYLAVSWLLVQITALAQPAFSMPDWVNTVVFYFAMIGLPIALILAWAFEMTPEGVRKTEKLSAEKLFSLSSRQKLSYVAVAALALGLGYITWGEWAAPVPGESETVATPDAKKTESIRSIAVLPFADMSAAGDQEYFGDGIAEELLNALVRIQSLRVTSRTSSFAFKNQPGISLTEIGAALNVNHILEGSVRTSGNTIRVTAQLIDVETDTHLWSGTYDRDIENIFAIQDEISHAIVDALKVAMGTGDETIVVAATTNMQAYDIYLRGKFAFARRARDRNEILKSVRLFDRAAELAPGFANAFAGLGRARAMMVNFWVPSEVADRREQMALARTATDRALMLEPDNVQALLSLAIIKYQFEADFEGAEQDFIRAVSLSPNDPEIRNFFGDYLGVTADYDRAMAMERRAAELDPHSIINAVEYGRALMLVGRTEEGLEIIRSVVAAEPEQPFSAVSLALAYFRSGQTDNAIKEIGKLVEVWPEEKRYAGNWYFYRAVNGDMDARQNFMRSAYATEETLFTASAFFELGDFDQAAVRLDQAYGLGLNYYNTIYLPLMDPREQVDHDGLNEIFSRPGLKELMEIRRRNLGLD